MKKRTPRQLANDEKKRRMHRQSKYGMKGAKIGALIGAGSGLLRGAQAYRHYGKYNVPIDPGLLNLGIASMTAKRATMGGLAGLVAGSAYGKYKKDSKRKTEALDQFLDSIQYDDISRAVDYLIREQL